MTTINETFKKFPLQMYSDRYRVSSLGEIWSYRTEKYLTKTVSKEYNIIYINKPSDKHREQHRVDNLIALAFLGEPKGRFLVHKDSNNLNDKLENLEWVKLPKYLSRKYGSIWKKLKSDNKYYISQDGQVWSSFSENLINQLVVSGYKSVNIGYPIAKFSSVHRLVAKTFCDNSNNKLIVNHIDEDKMNNNKNNLEWVTSSENSLHSIKPDRIRIQVKISSPPSEYKPYILDPSYLVEKTGQIYSTKSNMYLTRKLNNCGYYRVSLYINKKVRNVYIHRMVAVTFLPLPSLDKIQVNHKDMNRLNNHVDNLEWMSSKENNQHGKDNNKQQYKHLQKKVAQIDRNTDKVIREFDGMKVAARETGINSGSICKACKMVKPSAGGFKWKYIE